MSSLIPALQGSFKLKVLVLNGPLSPRQGKPGRCEPGKALTLTAFVLLALVLMFLHHPGEKSHPLYALGVKHTAAGTRHPFFFLPPSNLEQSLGWPPDFTPEFPTRVSILLRSQRFSPPSRLQPTAPVSYAYATSLKVKGFEECDNVRLCLPQLMSAATGIII